MKIFAALAILVSIVAFQNCGQGFKLGQVSINSKGELGVAGTRECTSGEGVGVQSSGACAISSCNPGFQLAPEGCSPGNPQTPCRCEPKGCKIGDVKTCRANNGNGQQVCIEESGKTRFGDCRLNFCNDGYAPSANGTCVAQACRAGQTAGCYIPNANGKKTCTQAGTWPEGCEVDTCIHPYKTKVENGVKYCSLEGCTPGSQVPCNWEIIHSGTRTCNGAGSGYSACELKNCADGFDLTAAGVCVAKSVQSCSDGVICVGGSRTEIGTCKKCEGNQRPDARTCTCVTPPVASPGPSPACLPTTCLDERGRGKTTCPPTTCKYEECFGSANPVGGSCVPVSCVRGTPERRGYLGAFVCVCREYYTGEDCSIAPLLSAAPRPIGSTCKPGDQCSDNLGFGLCSSDGTSCWHNSCRDSKMVPSNGKCALPGAIIPEGFCGAHGTPVPSYAPGIFGASPCICKDLYTGERCEIAPEDKCKPNTGCETKFGSGRWSSCNPDVCYYTSCKDDLRLSNGSCLCQEGHYRNESGNCVLDNRQQVQCSGNGRLIGGSCFCSEGWMGPNCEQRVPTVGPSERPIEGSPCSVPGVGSGRYNRDGDCYLFQCLGGKTPSGGGCI